MLQIVFAVSPVSTKRERSFRTLPEQRGPSLANKCGSKLSTAHRAQQPPTGNLADLNSTRHAASYIRCCHESACIIRSRGVHHLVVGAFVCTRGDQVISAPFTDSVSRERFKTHTLSIAIGGPHALKGVRECLQLFVRLNQSRVGIACLLALFFRGPQSSRIPATMRLS